MRGAILHEPGLYALVDDFDAVRAPVRALVQEAMEAGGPPAAVERFWCYVAGDDGWNRLAPALRERLRATAGTLFGSSSGPTSCTCPATQALAALSAPVRLLVSEDSLPFSRRDRRSARPAAGRGCPPLRARTRPITSTLRNSRSSSGHSSVRSRGASLRRRTPTT